MKLKIKEKAVKVRDKAKEIAKEVDLANVTILVLSFGATAGVSGWLAHVIINYSEHHLDAAVDKALEGKKVLVERPTISKDELMELEDDFITKAIEIFKEESKN